MPSMSLRLLVLLSIGLTVGISARAERVKDACLVVPFDQRASLSPACQKLLYEDDLEYTRFRECFRILSWEGVRSGRCDSKTRRYLADTNVKPARIVVMNAAGVPLGMMDVPGPKSER